MKFTNPFINKLTGEEKMKMKDFVDMLDKANQNYLFYPVYSEDGKKEGYHVVLKIIGPNVLEITFVFNLSGALHQIVKG